MEGITYFIHLFNSGGIVMYPLLLLSLVTIAIAIERSSYYKKNKKDMRSFVSTVQEAATKGDMQTINACCAEVDNVTSRVLASGLRNSSSEASMNSAFEAQMGLEIANLNRYLDYLSSIVTISPLLGLLGTVVGMIGTFSVLDGGAAASAISGGVGEALVATATGLCVAILAFCAYTCFSHQLNSVVDDTETLCVAVINAKKESWQ